MFYFYYPTELENLVGHAAVSLTSSNKSITKVEMLNEVEMSKHDEKSYLFYPTLSSLLSQCLLDLESRSKIIECYEALSKHIFELKKQKNTSLICIGISFLENDEFRTAVDDIQFKVSFSNDASRLEAMLSEFFVNKNRRLKKIVGSLTAISQFVEQYHISDDNLGAELGFVSDALSIKSTYGTFSEIEKAYSTLDDKLMHLRQLESKHEKLKKKHSNTMSELERQAENYATLKNDQERAIHQIQILQEAIVEKHQELSRKELENQDKYLKQISALNTENSELLVSLEELESDLSLKEEALLSSNKESQRLREQHESKLKDASNLQVANSVLEREKSALASKVLEAERAIDSSDKMLGRTIKELQNLQELYECKSIEATELTDANGELETESRVLAAKILELNKEQMSLSISYTSATEAAEKDRKQSIAKQKVLEREVTRFKTRNGELTHKYSSLRYEMFCTNRELELIHSSPFWKGSRLLKNLKSKLNRNRISDSVKADIALIATSEYFDFDWYLDTYGDVQEANIDPAQHYLIAGAEEGRLPSANFDGNWYLERYPDVAEAGINPLLHFIKCGKREGRVPSPKMLADKRKN